ncbi:MULTISPECIES: response regulator transcription factor [unclassified Carboxylicivirga]|uniref:response regulator transcription factor n=1 Tax=Carboxylicivirga TaxID=1628153 RepID=UPI003D3332DE
MIQIAIVEDHQMVREGLKVLIDQWEDIKVVAEFSSGEEWLASLQSHQYDVSLLDIDMPGMSGLEALDKAQQSDPSHRIIMLTMHRTANFFREAFIKGARGYVAKDRSVNHLAAAIREVSVGNTYFSDEFLKSLASNLKHQHDFDQRQTNNPINLNANEVHLLNNICQGYTNKELAEKMFLSVKTIESQKTKLMRKTDTKNNAGLIVWAIKNNVVDI